MKRRSVRRNPSPRAKVSRRRRTRTVARRSSPPKMTPAMRRKISIAVKAANRRRAASSGVVGRVRSAVASYRRRSPSRRFSGGISRGGGLSNSLKSFISKPMIMKATGAVGASVLTSYVLRNYGAKLPMANTTYGKALYLLGIPFAAAYLLRNKSPQLAEGIAIGGLVMGINTLIANVPSLNAIVTGTPAPATALPATGTTGVGSYGVAGQLGARRLAAYPQSPSHAGTIVGNSAAFDRAWN